jgi:deoxyribonuclease-4
MPGVRIGIHTSRSGCLENAATRAREFGANTFQIFSSSPRMWRASVLDSQDVLRFRAARERFDLTPLAIHVNYLMNPASLDPVMRARSIESFRGEIERAVHIGAEYLVVHPGNYKSHSVEEGMAAFVLALADAARDIRWNGLTVLIENTVGAGAQLGGRIEELRTMRDLANRVCDIPVGYCLDTCHLLASGFEIRTPEGLKATMAKIEEVLGLEDVKVIHANDSKGDISSHLDRHANIGEGHIGVEGFRLLLRHPGLRGKPFILETPSEEEGNGKRDVEMLKRLAEPESGAAPKNGTGKKKRNAGKGVRLQSD